MIKFSTLYLFMKEHNICRIRWVLDDCFVGDWEDTLKKYFVVNKLYTEYVYSVDGLSNMEGGIWKRNRKKCKIFEKEYSKVNYRVGELSDYPKIRSIYQKWCDDAKQRYHHIYDNKYLFDMFELNPKYFLIFFDDNKPIGFINYTPINKDMVYCGCRKLDISYTYISQYVEHKFGEYLRDLGYVYINSDSDDGKKGLSEFKNSFNPVFKMKEYELIRRE